MHIWKGGMSGNVRVMSVYGICVCTCCLWACVCGVYKCVCASYCVCKCLCVCVCMHVWCFCVYPCRREVCRRTKKQKLEKKDGRKPKTIFPLSELMSSMGTGRFLRLEGVEKTAFHSQLCHLRNALIIKKVQEPQSRQMDMPSKAAYGVHMCAQLCLTLWLHGLQTPRPLCLWDSPGKNTGVGCHFLLQGSSQPKDRTQVSPVSCTDRWMDSLPLAPPGKPAWSQVIFSGLIFFNSVVTYLGMYRW